MAIAYVKLSHGRFLSGNKEPPLKKNIYIDIYIIIITFSGQKAERPCVKKSGFNAFIVFTGFDRMLPVKSFTAYLAWFFFFLTEAKRLLIFFLNKKKRTFYKIRY